MGSYLLKYLEFIAHCDLSVKDYKVLLYLLSTLLEKEEIKLNQNSLAEDLGLTKSDVSKALRSLEQNKVLRFNWISQRKKYIGLVKYSITELDDFITEKIEKQIQLDDL